MNEDKIDRIIRVLEELGEAGRYLGETPVRRWLVQGFLWFGILIGFFMGMWTFW